jgi:Holliday junction resolvase RusA-like endonuclease
MKDIQTEKIIKRRANLTPKDVRPWLNIGDSAHYVIDGDPIPLKRPRFGLGRVFDSQKREKHGIQLQLNHQHGQAGYVMPFEGPLKLDVTFFMPIPDRLSKKAHGATGACPHYSRPDIDNLLKMILDCMQSVIKDDALVASVTARKVYSRCPRTEFSITRLESDGSTKE